MKEVLMNKVRIIVAAFFVCAYAVIGLSLVTVTRLRHWFRRTGGINFASPIPAKTSPYLGAPRIQRIT